MIISASRRTDIPAFYSQWFLNRLREGFLYVRNPFNHRQVSKVTLSPDLVDCIVFWTKNPTNMLDKLEQLDQLGYNYYFHFTLTPYSPEIEEALPPKAELVKVFKTLSQRLGKHRVIWRYDPVVLTTNMPKAYHYTNFELLAQQLCNHTKQCIISFVDFYRKTERNLKPIKILPCTEADMREIAHTFADIGKKYSITVKSCSEALDFTPQGVEASRCIDETLINRITEGITTPGKDKNQRQECGCVASIDIGAYNTCKHGCVYCYANFSDTTVSNNSNNHDVNSPLLVGKLLPEDKLSSREVKSFRKQQLSLLDYIRKRLDH